MVVNARVVKTLSRSLCLGGVFLPSTQKAPRAPACRLRLAMASLVSSLTSAASFGVFTTSENVGHADDTPLATYECIYVGTPSQTKQQHTAGSSEGNGEKTQANTRGDGLLGPTAPREGAHGGMAGGSTGPGPQGPSMDVYLPPHIGRLFVYRSSVHFKADMFGLDLTELVLRKEHVRKVDASQKFSVTLQDWRGACHEFQLPRLSREAYALLAKAWNLRELVIQKFCAANDKVLDPDADPKGALGTFLDDSAEAMNRARAELDAQSKTLLGRARREYQRRVDVLRALHRRGQAAYTTGKHFLFPPPPPPPPVLDTVDVKARTNQCLFLRIVAADDVIAMDSGGVSDPFAVARWGSLECKTEVVYETVSPEWDETFTFQLGSCPDVIEDDVTVCLYDYDLALNDFLGFVKVPLKGKRVSNPKDWSKEPDWYTIGPLPEGYDDDNGGVIDWGRMKDKLMFWEGAREYTGRVKVAAWIGNRSDPAMRTAEHPTVWKTVEASREEPKFYVEPHTAVVHVWVCEGRNILPMDGSRDDPAGLSDPYCEVTLEHERTGKLETEQTHYIDDSDTPDWDRKFSFVISRPYTTSTMWFKVYDFDGGFDQLIGQVKIRCEDLDIHEGLVKPPAARWHTLCDAAGEEKNAEGDPYGEILISAYIDEEYLEHMHLQKVDEKDVVDLGQLEVDVFQVHDLADDVRDVFVVCKYGPYWARLPTIEDPTEARYDLRCMFPVLDLHVPVIIAVFSGVGDAPRLLGKIKVPVAALESNERYFKVVEMGAIDPSSGEVVRNGKVDVALTFYRDANVDKTIALAKQYIKPMCADKWYYNPIPEVEQEKVVKRHKELVIHQLGLCNPPVKETIVKEMLDYGRHEFNSRMIQTSIARLQCVAAEGIEIMDVVNGLFSWNDPYVTGTAQAILFMMINFPRLILPGVLFLLGSIPLAMYPTRKKRALDQMAMDWDISVGKLPPHLDILLNGDTLTNEEIKQREKEQREREEAEAKAEEERKRAEEEEAARLKAEEDARAAEEAEAVAAILAEADAESEEDSDEDDVIEAPKMAGSMNPFANLMKQYEELTALIGTIQTAMDNVATVAEQLMGILTWREPRVTFVAMVLLMTSAIVLFFSQFIVEAIFSVMSFYSKKAVGAGTNAASSGISLMIERITAAAVAAWEYIWEAFLRRPYEMTMAAYYYVIYVLSTTLSTFWSGVMWVWSFFTLRNIMRVVRFAGSLYMLYALRHPSILPDEASQFKSGGGVDEEAEKKAQEEKKKAEEAKAKEAAEAKAAEPEKKERKKSKAEIEAEAEKERRRAARAAKKEAKRKQKEAEEAAKKARKAAGQSMIDNRPAAPINVFCRIPSKAYQVL